MNPPPNDLRPETLAEHLGWVRALARSLTSDSHLAEDLAQETCLAALRSPPPPDRPFPAWVRHVARNFARQAHRSRERATRREAKAARSERTASTDELVERVSTHRRIVEAVLELEEPYRSTIVLRYFEELPPRTIALREGVSVETVKTRLVRGLASLRRRLDREFGDRRTCLGALTALALRGEGHAVPWGALALKIQTKVGLVVLGCALAGSFLYFRQPDDPEPGAIDRASTAASTSNSPAAAQPSTPGQSDVGGHARTSRPTLSVGAEATNDDDAPESAGPHWIVGRVLGVDGLPFAGAEVSLATPWQDESGVEPRPTAVSDRSGVFELPVATAGGQVVCVSPGFTTVFAGYDRSIGATTTEPIVVVAPELSFAGTIVGPDGQPVPSAIVTVELPPGFRARFEEILDSSSALTWTDTSRDDGAFELLEVPFVAEATLAVSAEGFHPLEQALPAVDSANLEIVLTPLEPDHQTITGVVVDEQGEPIAGAHVAHGMDTTLTNSDGEFRFFTGAEGSFNRRYGYDAPAIIAVKAGYQPGSVERVRADSQNEWPDPLRITLGPPPLSIRGRVVDAEGNPLASHFVWLSDSTTFGALPTGQRPTITQLETLMAGREPAFWDSVRTDANGRFELDGLQDRPYRVAVLSPTTLQRLLTDPIPAGSQDIDLTLHPDELTERVAGRVVDRRGEPIPGITVMLMCDAFAGQFQGRTYGTRHLHTDGVETDEQGRFEFEHVPAADIYLRLGGDLILPLEYGRGHEGGLEGLVGTDHLTDFDVPVALRTHVRVELTDPARAQTIQFLDAEGEILPINVMEGRGRYTVVAYELVEGRTPTLAMPDTAWTLVFRRGEEEVHRMPVELHPGDINVLRW